MRVTTRPHSEHPGGVPDPGNQCAALTALLPALPQHVACAGHSPGCWAAMVSKTRCVLALRELSLREETENSGEPFQIG